MTAFHIAVVLALSNAFYLAVYRLLFHPLASVPGPKLAALTYWYESYYELLHRGLGGQYTFKIQQLHQTYGPIVRINPGEVHIDDPCFYSQVYTYRDGYDKPKHLKWRFGSPSALFSTPEHHLHKIRRSAQDPFFTKARILKLAPEIQAKADKMCNRLVNDFTDQQKPVKLDNLFASFIADVTTQFAFDKDFGFLDHSMFESPFVKAIRGFKDIAHPCTQFPWLARILASLPTWVVRVIQPSMSCVMDFQDEMRLLVRTAQSEVGVNALDGQGKTDRTIFHGILRSDLPKEELEVEILKDHAVSLIGAGIASAQWTLTVAFFHIINDSEVALRLKNELKCFIPEKENIITLEKLMQLPYLMACVEEAIRLACGQMTRSPRIPKKPIQYGRHVLPPDTLISMDTWHMHHNPVLFPDSFAFIPERWLDQPLSPAIYQSRPLRYYMVSFGKGTRHCIGMNLAYAEITIGLASLIRRFDWELWETSYADVEVVKDLIAPDVVKTSKGVRMLVKSGK
ncbi:putative cytochrome P450 [Xylaria flabelliformis]|nr:putative cytochrome P450 [Xylaria flabelliformis]